MDKAVEKGAPSTFGKREEKVGTLETWTLLCGCIGV